jgi:hypothetical protein
MRDGFFITVAAFDDVCGSRFQAAARPARRIPLGLLLDTPLWNGEQPDPCNRVSATHVKLAGSFDVALLHMTVEPVWRIR